MIYDVPTVTRCCLVFPLKPGILIYGIIRFIIAVLIMFLYVYMFIACNLIAEIPLIITLTIEIAVILDITTMIYFLYGYSTNNVKYLAKFYPFCLFTLALKVLAFFILAMVTKTVLVTPYVICLLLDLYMLVLIRTMMIQAAREEGHCEFVNKLANPDQIVNIEVVNDSIPDKYKNRVYLVSDRYIYGFKNNEEIFNKNFIGEEQKNVEKNTNEEKMDNNGLAHPIPPITVTHM